MPKIITLHTNNKKVETYDKFSSFLNELIKLTTYIYTLFDTCLSCLLCSLHLKTLEKTSGS